MTSAFVTFFYTYDRDPTEEDLQKMREVYHETSLMTADELHRDALMLNKLIDTVSDWGKNGHQKEAFRAKDVCDRRAVSRLVERCVAPKAIKFVDEAYASLSGRLGRSDALRPYQHDLSSQLVISHTLSGKPGDIAYGLLAARRVIQEALAWSNRPVAQWYLENDFIVHEDNINFRSAFMTHGEAYFNDFIDYAIQTACDIQGFTEGTRRDARSIISRYIRDFVRKPGKGNDSISEYAERLEEYGNDVRDLLLCAHRALARFGPVWDPFDINTSPKIEFEEDRRNHIDNDFVDVVLPPIPWINGHSGSKVVVPHRFAMMMPLWIVLEYCIAVMPVYDKYRFTQGTVEHMAATLSQLIARRLPFPHVDAGLLDDAKNGLLERLKGLNLGDRTAHDTVMVSAEMTREGALEMLAGVLDHMMATGSGNSRHQSMYELCAHVTACIVHGTEHTVSFPNTFGAKGQSKVGGSLIATLWRAIHKGTFVDSDVGCLAEWGAQQSPIFGWDVSKRRFHATGILISYNIKHEDATRITTTNLRQTLDLVPFLVAFSTHFNRAWTRSHYVVCRLKKEERDAKRAKDEAKRLAKEDKEKEKAEKQPEWKSIMKPLNLKPSASNAASSSSVS